MSNDLILIKSEVPAHIAAAGLARAMNSDAMAGISAGYPASIRTKNGRFRLVDSAGEETIVQAKDLEESKYLPVVVLGAKRDLSKSFFLKPYDPADEPTGPDCYSDDGRTPAADAKFPQCANCASCDKNAFGSGRNAAGQATKGKACTDNKILAVFYKGGIYQLNVKPASLKNWGAYVKALDQRNFPLGHVVTYISMDESSDYPITVFSAGKFIPEEKLAALAEKAAMPEVAEITRAKPSAPTASAIATPAPVEVPKPVAAKPAAKPKIAVAESEVVIETPTSLPGDDEIDDLLDF